MSTVTIKDIAKLAGVSHATVSRALNGAPGVRPETRARVLALCQQYGYRANQLARSLSASHTGIISAIPPELNNPLFSEIALDLEQYAQRRGYHVMLCHGRVEDPEMGRLFDFLIGHRVDGIILFSSARQSPELIRHYISRVPIVLQGIFDAGRPSMPVPTVSTDNEAGGRMAAEYLYRLGHRRVVYLGVRWRNVSHTLRCEGFDNISCSAFPNIRLTTIDQCKKKLTETAVECPLDLIDSPGHADPRPCLIPPRCWSAPPAEKFDRVLHSPIFIQSFRKRNQSRRKFPPALVLVSADRRSPARRRPSRINFRRGPGRWDASAEVCLQQIFVGAAHI